MKKCKPLKKIAETDAIFNEVHRVNKEADESPKRLRISLDTKASVNVGGFSRGGYNRQNEQGLDHDFGSKQKLTPFGIILPETKETFFWIATSKVTADFMVDRLEELYPKLLDRFPELDTLVINADNGCESSGRRTQWLKRLREFSDSHNITIELAYYPPYHSKYNPIERCWGVLENHWRGEILGSVEKVLGLARSMTYAGLNPAVRLVRKVYQSGVTVAKSEMQDLEKTLSRMPGLEKWFIQLKPQK